MHVYVCVYIYIYRERDIHTYIYIYIYTHIIPAITVWPLSRAPQAWDGMLDEQDKELARDYGLYAIILLCIIEFVFILL